jgi:hypothetical protein
MANINRNFGKLTGGELAYAPRSIIIDGREIWNPRAETYAAAGYLPVDTSAPSEPAPEGYHYEPRGWEIFDDDRSPVARHIRRVWEIVANPPPPPRRWTRLSIKTALAQAGMLDAARQFLSASEIATGYTAWEALTDCDYIEEGYPTAEAWSALLDGAAIALGKSRAEIDAFLANIPTE